MVGPVILTIFLTPRRHVAPCCEGEIRNIAKQKSRE
jgi:hypothetical protein